MAATCVTPAVAEQRQVTGRLLFHAPRTCSSACASVTGAVHDPAVPVWLWKLSGMSFHAAGSPLDASGATVAAAKSEGACISKKRVLGGNM